MFQYIFNKHQDLKLAKIFNLYDYYDQLYNTIEKKKLSRHSTYAGVGFLLTSLGCFLSGSLFGTNAAFSIGMIGVLFTTLLISQNEKREEKNKTIVHNYMRKELINHLKDRNDLFIIINELEIIHKNKPFSQLEKLIADIKNVYCEKNFFIEEVVGKLHSFISSYYTNEPNNTFDNEYRLFIKEHTSTKDNIHYQEKEIGNIKTIL